MRKKIFEVSSFLQKWIDRITTAVASVLIAVMFCVIIANVILRAVPAVGGFRWYMEFSQYANVWAMLIAAAGIAVQGPTSAWKRWTPSPQRSQADRKSRRLLWTLR